MITGSLQLAFKSLPGSTSDSVRGAVSSFIPNGQGQTRISRVEGDKIAKNHASSSSIAIRFKT